MNRLTANQKQGNCDTDTQQPSVNSCFLCHFVKKCKTVAIKAFTVTRPCDFLMLPSLSKCKEPQGDIC